MRSIPRTALVRRRGLQAPATRCSGPPSLPSPLATRSETRRRTPEIEERFVQWFGTVSTATLPPDQYAEAAGGVGEVVRQREHARAHPRPHRHRVRVESVNVCSARAEDDAMSPLLLQQHSRCGWSRASPAPSLGRLGLDGVQRDGPRSQRLERVVAVGLAGCPRTIMLAGLLDARPVRQTLADLRAIKKQVPGNHSTRHPHRIRPLGKCLQRVNHSGPATQRSAVMRHDRRHVATMLTA